MSLSAQTRRELEQLAPHELMEAIATIAPSVLILAPTPDCDEDDPYLALQIPQPGSALSLHMRYRLLGGLTVAFSRALNTYLSVGATDTELQSFRVAALLDLTCRYCASWSHSSAECDLPDDPPGRLGL